MTSFRSSFSLLCRDQATGRPEGVRADRYDITEAVLPKMDSDLDSGGGNLSPCLRNGQDLLED